MKRGKMPGNGRYTLCEFEVGNKCFSQNGITKSGPVWNLAQQ